MSGTWAAWCKEQQVEHINTTAFHPNSNGMIERLHRQLKDGLRARGAAEKWIEHLPWVVLGLRAAPKDESGVSAAEATLGQQLVIPGAPHLPDPPEPPPRAQPEVIPQTRRTYAEAVASPSPLDVAEFVYVRRGGSKAPLESEYVGPFRVVARGPKVFRIVTGNREQVVSRDRLKAHRGTDEPVVESPRGRGRPLGT